MIVASQGPLAGALLDFSCGRLEAFQSVARLLKKILGGAAVSELAV